jgi:hypothetical protein
LKARIASRSLCFATPSPVPVTRHAATTITNYRNTGLAQIL